MLGDGEKNIGVVTLDLGRTFDNASMDAVRQRVRKSAKIMQVFFCASHTHSGPVIEDFYPDGKLPPWQAAALDKIGAALEDAAGRMTPATIGTGFGQTYIGHNRRMLNLDGTVKMFWRNATKGSRKNYLAFCCRPPGPLARRERRAIPAVVCVERATKPAGLRAAA